MITRRSKRMQNHLEKSSVKPSVSECAVQTDETLTNSDEAPLPPTSKHQSLKSSVVNQQENVTSNVLQEIPPNTSTPIPNNGNILHGTTTLLLRAKNNSMALELSNSKNKKKFIFGSGVVSIANCAERGVDQQGQAISTNMTSLTITANTSQTIPVNDNEISSEAAKLPMSNVLVPHESNILLTPRRSALPSNNATYDANQKSNVRGLNREVNVAKRSIPFPMPRMLLSYNTTPKRKKTASSNITSGVSQESRVSALDKENIIDLTGQEEYASNNNNGNKTLGGTNNNGNKTLGGTIDILSTHHCDLCTALFQTNERLIDHRKKYHKIETAHMIGIPIINLSLPGVMDNITQMGFTNYILLPSPNVEDKFVVPIVPIDAFKNSDAAKASSFATSVVSLGPLHSLLTK